MSRRADLQIRVTGTRHQIETVLNSAIALPAGVVAIPADAGPSTLRDLGFTVRHLIRSGDSLPREALGVFPMPGTLVREHSIVRLVTGPQAWPNSSCTGLWIDIRTPTHTVAIVANPSGPSMTLHSGDSIRLEAVGRCSHAVRFNSDDGRVLRPGFRQELRARAPGTTHVSVWLAKCFVPGCFGGYDQLTRLSIHVLP
jgi:hypothetical protein